MDEPLPRFGSDWDGAFDDWLDAVNACNVHSDDLAAVPLRSFPTEQIRRCYLDLAPGLPEREVRHLLRLMLFDQVSFPQHDLHHLQSLVYLRVPSPRSEYERRLLRRASGAVKQTHPGVRWALDLLPHHPNDAVAVISSYFLAHAQALPDMALNGLSDAMAVIRAHYMSHATDGPRTLADLTPRAFESLVALLYSSLGYDVEMTPPQADGGIDVIARRTDSGTQVTLLVECKKWAKPVPVLPVRALMGVVAARQASGGVFVTTSRFTRGVRTLAASEPRLDLVDGRSLAALLAQQFSTQWPLFVDRLVVDGQSLGRSSDASAVRHAQPGSDCLASSS